MPLFSEDLGRQIFDLGNARGARDEQARNAVLLASAALQRNAAMGNFGAQPSGQSDPYQISAPTSASLQTEEYLAPEAEKSADTSKTYFSQGFAPTLPFVSTLPAPKSGGSVSQSSSYKRSGISGSGRDKAENLMFSLLENRDEPDIESMRRRVNYMRAQRPIIVANLYGGESSPELKGYDSELAAAQTELDNAIEAKGKAEDRALQVSQKAVASFAAQEIQAAKMQQVKDLAEKRDKLQRDIARNRLSFDETKLFVESTLRQIDQELKDQGIYTELLANPQYFNSLVMSGKLGPEMANYIRRSNELRSYMSRMGQAASRAQSTNPQDVLEAFRVAAGASRALSQRYYPGGQIGDDANDVIPEVTPAPIKMDGTPKGTLDDKGGFSLSESTSSPAEKKPDPAAPPAAPTPAPAAPPATPKKRARASKLTPAPGAPGSHENPLKYDPKKPPPPAGSWYRGSDGTLRQVPDAKH